MQKPISEIKEKIDKMPDCATKQRILEDIKQKKKKSVTK